MTVVVYSTPTCPYCQMARRWLKEHGVDFEDVDVSQDPARAQEMIDKSGQTGVPVIDVDGTIIVGFDQSALENAVAKQ